MAAKYFVQMALNNAWANGVLYDAVETLPEADFTAARPSFFGSIARTLNHIHAVDLYYIDALCADGPKHPTAARVDVTDAHILAGLQKAADTRLVDFCKNLTPEILLAGRTTYRGDATVTERVDRLLLHIVQHQIHHRGQVHALLSHAGIKPPQLDDFYLEYGRVASAERYWRYK